MNQSNKLFKTRNQMNHTDKPEEKQLVKRQDKSPGTSLVKQPDKSNETSQDKPTEKTRQKPQQKQFQLHQIIIILLVTVSILMIAITLEWPLFFAILPGLLLLWVLSRRIGYRHIELFQFSKKGIQRNINVAWLLLFIGLLLPTWYYSGTINDLNSLFLTIISPNYFFTVAFLVTAMMSMVVGSAIASLSIVGVPMMVAGEQLGMPGAVVAGALISGGFLGDRTSPISSSFQLLRASVELESRAHLKAILPTMWWGLGVTTCLYLLLDFLLEKESVTPALTSGASFTVVGLLISLLPPLVLLAMIMLGQEMKRCFTMGIGTAVVILIARGVDVKTWLGGLLHGVDSLNGVFDMLPFILFILLVGMYCQIMEDTQMVQPFIARIFEDTSSLVKNTVKSIGVAAGVSLISPNQSFPIILTGRTLFPFWNKHFSKGKLARILADSTVVFAGLVPWSLLAILCSAIVGVPVLAYVPFAFFLLIMPIITMMYSAR